jgi:hypothetical protein
MWVSKYLIPSSDDSPAKECGAWVLQIVNVPTAAKKIEIRYHVSKPVRTSANADSVRNDDLQLASMRLQCRW